MTSPTDQSIATFFGGPITQAHNPPTEYGVDIGLPAGTPVYQLVGGTFEPSLSTPYSAVFQTPSGKYEDYLHITPESALGGYVPAGQLVGSVSPLTGTINETLPTGQVSFTSTGPHLEYGYYANPTDASYASGSSALDPAQALSDASMPSNNTQSSNNPFSNIGSDISNYFNYLFHPGLSGVNNPTDIVPKAAGAAASAVAGAAGQTAKNVGNIFGITIPADIGIRLAVIAVALALLIIGGIALAGPNNVIKAVA